MVLTNIHGYVSDCLCVDCRKVRSFSNLQQQAQATADPGRREIRWHYPRTMEASDLGIIDQNLDDKVGMDL